MSRGNSLVVLALPDHPHTLLVPHTSPYIHPHSIKIFQFTSIAITIIHMWSDVFRCRGFESSRSLRCIHTVLSGKRILSEPRGRTQATLYDLFSAVGGQMWVYSYKLNRRQKTFVIKITLHRKQINGKGKAHGLENIPIKIKISKQVLCEMYVISPKFIIHHPQCSWMWCY